MDNGYVKRGPKFKYTWMPKLELNDKYFLEWPVIGQKDKTNSLRGCARRLESPIKLSIRSYVKGKKEGLMIERIK